MPNIEMTNVGIYGTCDAVSRFVYRYHFQDDPEERKAYFSEYYLTDNHATVEDQIAETYTNAKGREKRWLSVWMCRHPESLDMIEQACIEDDVKVVLSANDFNNGCRYETICTANGAVCDKYYYLGMCRCPKCGMLTDYPLFEPEQNMLCPNCGHCGLVLLDPYLASMTYSGPKIQR